MAGVGTGEWIDIRTAGLWVDPSLTRRPTAYVTSPPTPLPHTLSSGESWDYMGSRRLLLDMNMNTTSTSGLNLTLIDQVIEMGQV